MLPIEQCYGVIVVSKEEKPKFLILKQIGNRENDWSFAKGHMEEGESPIETAMRELEEETGIKEIEILDLPLIHEEYELTRHDRKSLKVNEYFIGVISSKEVKMDIKEHSEYKWVTFEEALNTFCHESRNEVLKEAKNYLDSVVK
jgi:8-oxo-dGTP pyrophosphatase MutT (NUDIX family)